MTYKQKLLDPRWQKKRLDVLSRDEFTCKLCNDTKDTLHVHHKSYSPNRNPWDTSLEDLVTYCATCHLITEYYKNLGVSLPISVIKLGDQFDAKEIIAIQKIDGQFLSTVFGIVEGSRVIYNCSIDESWVFSIASKLIQLKKNG